VLLERDLSLHCSLNTDNQAQACIHPAYGIAIHGDAAAKAFAPSRPDEAISVSDGIRL
jgi:hypothetical protein